LRPISLTTWLAVDPIYKHLETRRFLTAEGQNPF